MKKIIKVTAIIMNILVLAWFALSFGEFFCKNLSHNRNYNEYNVIANIIEYVNENN